MILDATIISLKVVSIAVMVTLGISLVVVAIVYRNKNTWAKVLELFIILPMFIPPSAIGYLILIVLGKNGFVGKIINRTLGTTVIFTLSAAVIASIVVTIPIMYQSIKSAVISIDKEIIDAARVFGANQLKVFTKIIFPLSKRGICSGMLLSFGRAFGEFGATILVAGNIPGRTQTLPMALYNAIENNNNEVSIKIFIIVITIAIFLMSIYNFLEVRK